MDFYREESNIFYIYFQLIKKYKTYMERELAEYRLTPSEIDVLSFIVNNETRNITAKDIGLYRGISKGLVSKAVNSLIESGLVETSLNPSDGRSLYLVIADRQAGLILDLKRVNNVFVKKLLEDIAMDELKTFLEINRKMLDNIGAI